MMCLAFIYVKISQNIVQGILVNGSLGKVEAFMSASEARKQMIETSHMDRRESRHDSLQTSDVVDPEKEETLQQNARVWPLVQFTNGRKVLCIPHEFSIESAAGVMEAKREQIPLILAWALSIHKSQGQTIERVKVDLGRTFEKGQGN